MASQGPLADLSNFQISPKYVIVVRKRSDTLTEFWTVQYINNLFTSCIHAFGDLENFTSPATSTRFQAFLGFRRPVRSLDVANFILSLTGRSIHQHRVFTFSPQLLSVSIYCKKLPFRLLKTHCKINVDHVFNFFVEQNNNAAVRVTHGHSVPDHSHKPKPTVST